jgi:putative ABC transport system substrate-binding protein
VKRRTFIATLGGAAAWPLAARAQKPGRMRLIGVITGDTESNSESQIRGAAFRHGLEQLGWAEGRNTKIEYRWGVADASSIREQTTELVKLGPDVIVSMGTPVTAGLQQATHTIPIVFTLVADPVAAGLVANLAHPGGNITGFTNYEYAIGGKWLETLEQIAPRTALVLVILNPDNLGSSGLLRSIDSAARVLNIKTRTASALDVAEMNRTIEVLGHESNGALLVLPDAVTSNFRDSIVALAARYHLPAIYPFRYFAVAGGLISYGIDAADPFRRAASYVDRILRGSDVSDLPVEAPTKFELVINLKTAKMLGLKIPPALLARADEVIE